MEGTWLLHDCLAFFLHNWCQANAEGEKPPQATLVELSGLLENLIIFTYPDAAVKSPHSDDVIVVFCC